MGGAQRRCTGGAREVHGCAGCAWGLVGIARVAAWGVHAAGKLSASARDGGALRELSGDYSFGVQALSSAEQASLAC